MTFTKIEDRLRESAETFVHGGIALAVVAGERTAIMTVPSATSSGIVEPDDNTRFHICSVSKHFFAAAALQLAVEETIDLDSPCCELVPELSTGRDFPPWSLRDLLTMRTGLGRDGIAEWGFDQKRPKSDRVSRARFMSRISLPGSGFTYSNLGYIALGLALERASGRRLGDLLSALFFDPLKMHDSRSAGADVDVLEYVHLPSLDVGGAAVAVPELTGPNSEGSARIYLSPRDALLWINHLIEQTQVERGHASLSELARPQTPVTAIEMPFCPPMESNAYGCGLFIGNLQGKRILHHGGAGRGWRHQLIFAPEARCGLMLMASTESPRLAGLAWDLIADLLSLPTGSWIDMLDFEARNRADRERAVSDSRTFQRYLAELTPGFFENRLTGAVEVRNSSSGLRFLPQDAPDLSAVIEQIDEKRYRLIFEHPAMFRQPLDPDYWLGVTEHTCRRTLDVTYFGTLESCH